MTPEELKERDDVLIAAACDAVQMGRGKMTTDVREYVQVAACVWDAAHAPKPCCFGEPESWTVAIGNDVMYKGPLSGAPKVLQDALVSAGLVPATKPQAPEIEVGTWVRNKAYPGWAICQVAFIDEEGAKLAGTYYTGVFPLDHLEPVAQIDIRPGDCVRAVHPQRGEVRGQVEDTGLLRFWAADEQRFKLVNLSERMSLLALPCDPKDDRLNPPKEATSDTLR